MNDPRPSAAPAARSASKRRGDPADRHFELGHSPFFLLNRLSNRYVLDMEATLKTIDMDIPRWRALMIVQEREPSSVSEIADLGCIRLSTMTRVVQRLVRQGLVRVRPRDGDARKTDVYLTPAGRAACDDVRRIASVVYGQAFEGFKDAEIATFCEQLRRVHANLQAAGPVRRGAAGRAAARPKRAARSGA